MSNGEAFKRLKALGGIAREQGFSVGMPFRRIPDRAWQNLADPATFIVSSILTLFFAPPTTAPRDDAYFAVLGARLGGVLVMIVVLVAPPLVGLLFPDVHTGNEYAYAVTLLVAGAVTMIPGRVAELRDLERIRGVGYPKRLRRTMWAIECTLIVAGLSVALSWSAENADTAVAPAVGLGLAATSLSDICVLLIARSIAVSDSVARA
jgi:hypothetical protein